MGDRILFGAAYYHEYQPAPRLEQDLDLMAAARFSVIRVGESVWSTWEPSDGRFELDWMQPILDGAHERGIGVVLGTPTYAIPMWLARRHPELAGERATGVRIPWGARQEVDFTHPAFRFHAERVIRVILERYAGHPAVIGFQVDNEPGGVTLHNESVFQRFVDQLRDRYGTVEELNEAWGLTFWSHRLTTWSELWRPDGNAQPQYDLAWRTFQSSLTTEFIAWQAAIVREYATDAQFVTTCMTYTARNLDEIAVTRHLDVAAANPYYEMQDGLDFRARERRRPRWPDSGPWSLFHAGDRMYSDKQAGFLVTETNSAAIGGSAYNYPAYPGQWRQAAWALIARGAEMIEYWHWHSAHAGAETYTMGALSHDQRPGRFYEEIAGLGAELEQLGGVLHGLRPDAGIGLLYSTASRRALAGQPCIPRPDLVGPFGGDEQSYSTILNAFAEGAFLAGARARIIHDDQILEGDWGLSPEETAAQVPVLIVAGLLVATDELLNWLLAYTAAGGHLVLGIRSAYADAEGRARTEIKPAVLANAAGVEYQEFSNVDLPVRVVGETSDFEIADGASAREWIDGLVPTSAEPLASYQHPFFGHFPAIVTNRHGAGQITTMGCLPDRVLATNLIRWLCPDPHPSWGGLPAAVSVSAATLRDGRRLHVVHNWSWDSHEVTPLRPMANLDGAPVPTVRLAAWDVQLVTEATDG